MPSRRRALVALFTLPVAVASTSPKSKVEKPRRVVLPEAGIRRIEEILAKEGVVVTGITISCSHPPTSRLGAHWSTSYLFQKEVEGLKIEQS